MTCTEDTRKRMHGASGLARGVYCQDAPAAIDWLCRVFGFELRLKVEGDNGGIVHSELAYGEGLIMVGSTGTKSGHQDGRIVHIRRAIPEVITGGSCNGCADRRRNS